MNPIAFQKKWLANTLKERSASQPHFLDICALVNHPTPSDLDPEGATETELKKRTRTNLYNARPTWLVNAHAALDRAVWTAYDWDNPVPAEVDEDTTLSRSLALNGERAAGS